MRKILVAFILLAPLFSVAQMTVPQGGTGTTTFPTNYVVVGNSALRLKAVATSTLGLPTFADLSSFSTTSASFWLGSSTTIASNILLARIGASTYSTVQHLMNLFSSTGRSSGGAITDAGSGVASVAAGTGFIKATDSDVAQLNFFDWIASTTINFPSATSTLFMGVNYNAGSPAVTFKTSDSWNIDTEFPLGEAIRESGTVYLVNDPWWVADPIGNIIERFDSDGIIRDDRTGGLVLSNTGTRNVAVTSGAILSRLTEFTIAAIDTSAAGSFDAYYRDGSGGWTKQAAQTAWNNSQYDDGDGALGSMTALSFASRWFYIMTDGSLAMLYGQENLTSLSLSLNESPPTTVPDRIKYGGILIGRFIIQASGGTPTQTQSAFGTAFTSAQVTSHTNLSDLAWTSSGHTGTANHIPYFSSTGAAASDAAITFDGLKLITTSASTTNLTASSYLAMTGTATSTFGGGIDFTRFNLTASSTASQGINLTGGCYSQSGNCLSSPPIFNVNRNGVATTTVASSYIKIDFTTEALDTTNSFNLTTERYTPTTAGIYLFAANAYCTDSTDGCAVAVRKNSTGATGDTATEVCNAAFISIASTDLNGIPFTFCLVAMNGSTDYVEAYVLNLGGTQVSGGIGRTGFSGYLISR